MRETHDRTRRLRHVAARHPTSHQTPAAASEKKRSSPVYDMYPDAWGPAKNRAPFESAYDPDGRSHEALQASLDRRDNGGQRPDDN